MFTYYINADSSGFKIEYPFSSIKNITLDSGDASSGAEGASQRSGGLVVELNQPPAFSMDPGSGGFFQCRDFTEDLQASKILVHHLGGHSKILSGQLAKLVSLDSFRNRHRPPEPTAMNMTPQSAPVSPITMRPASQPNHLIHPAQMRPPPPEASASMRPPPMRAGHKRQRSRSVPANVDFSQLRRPFNPFVQAEIPMHMNAQNQHIHAPIPQYSFSSAPQPLQNGVNTVGSNNNNNLSINTTAAGYDFTMNGPVSATTVNSSEFEPNFFTAGPPSEAYSTPNLHTPFQPPASFMSPMPNHAVLNQRPMSPFSTYSHGDPIIANQSPPLGMDRSASADIYHQGGGNQGMFQDDAFNFSEMYSKQTFQLPFRSPKMGNAPEPTFDFQHMVNFDESNSASMSPDHSR